MSNSQSHIKTAHAWGVGEALRQVGYNTVDEVNKEANDLGILETSKTASTPGSIDLGALFRDLGK